MISKLKYILDPLDREVLDRALDEALAAVHAKANTLIESGSDEELEALLRRELMDIASFNGLDEQSAQKILSESGLDLSARNRQEMSLENKMGYIDALTKSRSARR